MSTADNAMPAAQHATFAQWLMQHGTGLALVACTVFWTLVAVGLYYII
jgi:hypothetical protein